MLLLVRWEKANTAPVCFGAKNTRFGVFCAPSSGRLAAVGLEHLYGYVTCSTGTAFYWSFWGCGNHPAHPNAVGVSITTSGDHVLLPPSQFDIYGGMYFQIPGYNPNSPQLQMSFFSPLTFYVSTGDRLRQPRFQALSPFPKGGKGERAWNRGCGYACCMVKI